MRVNAYLNENKNMNPDVFCLCLLNFNPQMHNGIIMVVVCVDEWIELLIHSGV